MATEPPEIPLAPFLEKVFEDYLFGDLDSMTAEEYDDKPAGALGYPILMAVLAGSELLGRLDGGRSKHRVEDYWRKYLSRVNRRYGELARVGQELLRNGLMHGYSVKHNIIVGRGGRAADWHLDYAHPGPLHIDCLTLADDFRQSYPYAKTQLLANPGAQGWLDEISTEAWEDSRRVLASIASDPSVTLAGPLTPGEMTAASGIVGPGPTASPSAFTGLFVVPDDRED